MSCFICKGVDGNFIQSTHIISIINASRQREDGHFHKIEEGTTHVTCHSNCLSTYCSKHHIERLFVKRQQTQCENSQTSKRLRSHSSRHSYNLMEHCLFCGDDCFVVRLIKHPDRWREAYVCRTVDRHGNIPFKETVINHVQQRGDEWGRDVAFRTQGAVSDLHSFEARCHVDCWTQFFSNPAASGNVNETDIYFYDLKN